MGAQSHVWNRSTKKGKERKEEKKQYKDKDESTH